MSAVVLPIGIWGDGKGQAQAPGTFLEQIWVGDDDQIMGQRLLGQGNNQVGTYPRGFPCC